jgi:hypothetical protein
MIPARYNNVDGNSISPQFFPKKLANIATFDETMDVLPSPVGRCDEGDMRDKLVVLFDSELKLGCAVLILTFE